MELEEVKYAVMKLCKNVEMETIFDSNPEKVEISGIAGFIPVFDSLDEAEENSQDGKYEIMMLAPSEK